MVAGYEVERAPPSRVGVFCARRDLHRAGATTISRKGFREDKLNEDLVSGIIRGPTDAKLLGSRGKLEEDGLRYGSSCRHSVSAHCSSASLPTRPPSLVPQWYVLFASYWEGKTDDDLTIMERKDFISGCGKIYEG